MSFELNPDNGWIKKENYFSLIILESKKKKTFDDMLSVMNCGNLYPPYIDISKSRKLPTKL